ncbi:putative intracellular protease/amidase [Rhizobium sp. BK529]|uniref:type 1 glutamine amidotransferase family protein n=1 Tax=Rhizobium sp. BK529 TaxID=2586983 RepID=UPI00160D70E9|nr:type 1 glutamine amidotransferase family protein [Rhizobium sp. BK529]MBB3592081.1 putative intracellular protease/amidase [Rhizobium sp. BK529]
MTRLAVVLTDGFADWEVGQLAASARTHFGFDVVTASPGGAEVRSMGGLRVAADTVAENLHGDAFDALVICGGTIWDTEKAPDLSLVINDFIGRGKLTAAICGGTLALARAGVLNDIPHTSNAPDFVASAEGYRGQAHYRDGPQAVRSGMIVTAPGSAPITFTAEIFRALGFGSEELDTYVQIFGAEHQPKAA